MKLRILKVLGMLIFCGTALLLMPGCDLWDSDTESVRSLVIKPEDFSIFIFESSEEIYRANVKDPAMWAGLKEQANRDSDYASHYNWLYSTYKSMDERRRAQLKEIMDDYHPQPMADRLIQKGKQGADLEEILKFIKEDRYFSKNRNTLVDFYSWYGANYALPHYEQVKPLLQRKAQKTNSLVEKDFDVIAFMEKETGIKLKKKPENIELLMNMRIYGGAGFYRDKDSLTTIQWNSPPEKTWSVPFHEFSTPYFRTFTGNMTFKYLNAKLKKDEKLMTRFKEDVPYTWDGWIEENLTEGFARYLSVRKGITRDVGEGVYIFDHEYAQALVAGFDPQKTSLEDFTVKFLKQRYQI
ncbi:hypothetical protein Psfp_00748 [Pelotomaculum sp. FP]|uniref:hypothetical protein n=1 Tax=Pelotomaculum sp. FP TaxID=261474 RepID=UPI001066ADEE|nr:hypothetical protein [Pelotomaculum sp. FP]TEB17244.1 hypothetical protein Psfp_00748 [Pelotomaculum sp. FP]